MNRLLVSKKNILETIIFSLIGFLIIIFNKISLCKEFFGIGFDEQAFLYWDYFRSLGLTPIKDFFYPYGILFYHKETSIFWFSISLALIYLVVIIIFLTFRSIFTERKYLLLYFFTFCLFVNFFVHQDTFLRYSPLIAFGSLLSYLANKKMLFSKIATLIVGVFVGISFTFINDLFFYMVIAYLFLIFLYFFENRIKEKLTIYQVVEAVAIFISGFFISIIPFILYLLKNGLFQSFIIYFSTLKDFAILAKVAFPPSLRSLENILIIACIVFSIFAMLLIYKKGKLSFKFYLLTSLTILILALEQKNLIRSIYEQISFISLISFFILLDEFKNMLKNKIKNQIFYLFSVNFLFLVFLIIIIDRGLIGVNRMPAHTAKLSYCINEKINIIDDSSLVSFYKIRDYINSDLEAKIFSFPGDPIFYFLFNQIPPYYPSIYEATPVYAQDKLIRYIKENHVEYVIINTKFSAIQDGVPDVVRARLLYKYIIDNFKKEKKIDSFLILRKNPNWEVVD